MRIHCFQHIAFDNPGTILEWAKAHSFSVSYPYFCEANSAIRAQYAILKENRKHMFLLLDKFLLVA
jgi:hypothetical protein